MLHAIVPVKSLSQAKSRLAEVLSPEQRRTLVLAMLRDVLTTLQATPSVHTITVISGDPVVRSAAARIGVSVLLDHAGSLNGALTQAATHAAALGAGAVLVMPADVPLVKVHEVETLADAARVQGSVALVPSSDGGTNALLVRPPLGVPFLFGAESMVRHQVVAQERGLMVSIVRLAGLGLDVDRPEDLAWLAEQQGSSAAQRLARSFGLVARPVCCEC